MLHIKAMAPAPVLQGPLAMPLSAQAWSPPVWVGLPGSILLLGFQGAPEDTATPTAAKTQRGGPFIGAKAAA